MGRVFMYVQELSPEIDADQIPQHIKDEIRKDIRGNILQLEDDVALVLGIKYDAGSAPEIRKITQFKYFEGEYYDFILQQRVKGILAQIFFNQKLQRWCKQVVKVV